MSQLAVPYKSREQDLGMELDWSHPSHPRQLYWTGSSMHKSLLAVTGR